MRDQFAQGLPQVGPPVIAQRSGARPGGQRVPEALAIWLRQKRERLEELLPPAGIIAGVVDQPADERPDGRQAIPPGSP